MSAPRPLGGPPTDRGTEPRRLLGQPPRETCSPNPRCLTSLRRSPAHRPSGTPRSSPDVPPVPGSPPTSLPPSTPPGKGGKEGGGKSPALPGPQSIFRTAGAWRSDDAMRLEAQTKRGQETRAQACRHARDGPTDVVGPVGAKDATRSAPATGKPPEPARRRPSPEIPSRPLPRNPYVVAVGEGQGGELCGPQP